MIKLNKNNTALIIGVLVVIAIGLVTYFNFKSKNDKLEFEKAESLKEDIRLIQRKEDLQECSIIAWSGYNETWDSECSIRELGVDCLLPIYIAESLTETRETTLSNCVKLYGN